MKEHRYRVTVAWTGNTGAGTASYGGYDRAHLVSAPGKPDIAGSSDPAFRGDPARWSPEELLVAALAACHQLWFLHLAAETGLVVTAYEDAAQGVMVEEPGGAGRFGSVTLRPRVTIAGGDAGAVPALHERAHAMCFVARSVAFPVRVEGAVGNSSQRP